MQAQQLLPYPTWSPEAHRVYDPVVQVVITRSSPAHASHFSDAVYLMCVVRTRSCQDDMRLPGRVLSLGDPRNERCTSNERRSPETADIRELDDADIQKLVFVRSAGLYSIRLLLGAAPVSEVQTLETAVCPE